MKLSYLKCEHSSDSALIAQWAPRIGVAGWIILEEYPKVTFSKWQPREPLPQLGSEFNGRIFGDRAELRWTREGDRFDLWLLEDVDAAGAGIQPVNVETRNYYALGYWSDRRQYWEPTLTLDHVDYPLPPGSDGDRPRFKANEYFQLPPTAWPDDPGQIEDIVNRPSLIAYRLLAFDAGRDSK